MHPPYKLFIRPKPQMNHEPDLYNQWRIQGGGGRGSGPPPFGPRCRLCNIGPKVGPPPPFFACSTKMQWRILWMTSHGQCPRGGGGACGCPRAGVFFNFLRADVTRTMSKGGGACEKSCIRVWTPPPFKNPGSAPDN